MFRYKLRTLLIVLELGPPIVAAAIVSPWPRRAFTPRLRVEIFIRIQIGMTQTKVEALLGGPPGNYGRYDRRTGVRTDEGYQIPPGSSEMMWYDDANRFELYFDNKKFVVGMH